MEWGAAPLLLAGLIGGGLFVFAYVEWDVVITVAAAVVTLAFLGTSFIRVTSEPRGVCSVRVGFFGYSTFAWHDIVDLELAAAPEGVGEFGVKYAKEGTFYGVTGGVTVRVRLASGPTLFLGVSDARGLLRRLDECRREVASAAVPVS